MIISRWLNSLHRKFATNRRRRRDVRVRNTGIDIGLLIPRGAEGLEDRCLLSADFPEFVDPNPNWVPYSGNGFGTQGLYHVVPLSTGNVVITSPYDDAGGTGAGAVYLFNGATGELISTLTGSSPYDHVGIGGVRALPNGNYVVLSGHWDHDGVRNVGAITFGSGTTGVSGTVSAANSLVGSWRDDDVGARGSVQVLTNGNYVVHSPDWNNRSVLHGGTVTDAGAVTFGSGVTGVTGVISAANSLVGSKTLDGVDSHVTPLTNGNYVVSSPDWDNGAVVDAGAVTFGSGVTGVTGVVSAANSLVGGKPSDSVGMHVTPLANGNYVVSSANWDNGAVADVGAATFGSGVTGVTGIVSAANSLVGGSFVTALTNGNYVVTSGWDNGAVADVGAVTFGNGVTGVTGLVSAANSLVGSKNSDRVGRGYVTALTNGNYVVSSPDWDNGAVADAGAVTFGSGVTGVTGVVSAANSLVGSSDFDYVGRWGSVTALTNGNYVVSSARWDNGPVADAGAVTFGNGITGVNGVVSGTNSLVGTTAFDSVGAGGVGESPDDIFSRAAVRATPLTNGNYVVVSGVWNNGAVAQAGAVTFGDGNSGVRGAVSAANSLVGTTTNDQVGQEGVTALTNGNYVVSSSQWNNADAANAGAVTFGNGVSGVSGAVSVTNSLVGSATEDNANYFWVTPLTNGNYLAHSKHWADAVATYADAAMFGNGVTGTTGEISAANSLARTSINDNVGVNVTTFTDGGYVVKSVDYLNKAAFTFGNGEIGISGSNHSHSSLTAYAGYGSILTDEVNEHFLIPSSGRVWVASMRDGFALHDFGDAPDAADGTAPNNYQTRKSDDGPRHHIDSRILLGASVDGEASAQANFAASGDDVNGAGIDDEDGVLNPLELRGTTGTQPRVTLLANNTAGSAATLSGWIDYNGDGVFDNVTERAQIAVPADSTDVRFTLTFPTIPIGSAGETYARFRLSTDIAAANPTGLASDGEVEDYVFSITMPAAQPVTVDSFVKIAHETNGGPTLAGFDSFGSAMSGIGDLDGDGVTDLAVGARGDDTGGGNRGAVYVLLMNADGSVKSSTKIASSIGGGPTLTDSDTFGRTVSNVGDLDGDGITDMAVGAIGDDTGGGNRGAVYVLLLNADGTVKSSTKIASGTGGGPTLANHDIFGSSVSGVGDLDGDGIADLAVGANGDDTGGIDRGAVYVLLLNADGTVKTSTKIASSTGGGPALANRDFFGHSVSGVGDLDGDGIADLAVGAFFNKTDGTNRGAVYMLLLNANGTAKSSTKITSNSSTAGSLALLNKQGTVTRSTALTISPVVLPPAKYDYFGSSVSGMGDLDGDGVPDLAVGARADDAGGRNRGAVHVLLLNANGTVKSSTKIASSTSGGPTLTDYDLFGSSVSNVGDLDGDGVADLAVGAFGDDTGGPHNGAVYILSLKPGITDQLGLLTDAGRTPGNVVAVEQGTGVALVPDNNDNGVYVFADTNGDIVIRGLAGTTVNGMPQAVLFPGGGSVAGTFRVLASAGTMLTAIDGISLGGLSVTGGNDQESLELTNVTVTGNTGIVLNAGDDSIVTRNGSSGLGKVTITTGDGNDSLIFTDTTFGVATNIKTGDNDDTLSIYGATFNGSATIQTEAGSDTINGITVNTMAPFRLKTGEDDDTTTITGFNASEMVIIEPESGSDSVSVSHSMFADPSYVNLGGTDTLNLTASTLGSSININTLNGTNNVNFTDLDITGGVNINAAIGTTTVDVNDVSANAVFVIRTGTNNDTVEVTNSNFADALIVDTGDGNDQLDIMASTVVKQLRVNLRNGVNNAVLKNVDVSRDLLLNAGHDGNTITLDNVDVTVKTSFATGSGQDSVTILGSNFAAHTSFNTGFGNDTIDVALTTFHGNTTFKAGPDNDTLTGTSITGLARLTFDSEGGDDTIDFNMFNTNQLTITPGSGNNAVRLTNATTTGSTNIGVTSGNSVVDLQDNAFGAHVQVATVDAHLGVRLKNNSFTTAGFIAGTAATDEVFLDDNTSTFNSGPNVLNFDDLSNTHIDALFSNLLGLLFP